MKKYGYPALVALMALLLAVFGAALAFLPDTVPVHYNFAGEADRMGSKLEFLLFPGIMAGMGAVFALIARRCGKRDTKEGALTEKILLITAFFEVLLFGGLGLYFMWKAARYTPGDVGPAASADFMRFLGIGTGVLLVLLGNVMPKAARNAVFGLRTKWSMANDEAWRRSQRFGGFSAVAVGFLLIVAGMFLDGLPCLILCAVVVTAWAGACIGASYRYYKAGLNRGE